MFSVTNVIKLVGIYKPNEWDENWGKDEHEGLLLDYTEGMTVVVVVGQTLDDDCHHAGSKEHANRVLEGEGEGVIWFIVVILEVCTVVKDWSHDKFIVEDDTYEGGPGYNSGDGGIGLCGWGDCSFFDVELCTSDKICFSHVDKVEGDKGEEKEE